MGNLKLGTSLKEVLIHLNPPIDLLLLTSSSTTSSDLIPVSMVSRQLKSLESTTRKKNGYSGFW